MHIDILSVLPELLESPFQHSIMKRAQEKGLLTVSVHSLRKWSVNEYGQIDDYQYGGGAGIIRHQFHLMKMYSCCNSMPYSHHRESYISGL